MVLSLGGTLFGWGRYWPPEKPDQWQHRSFRVLFRIALYPLIVLSILIAKNQSLYNPVLGFVLMGFGFGLALLFTNWLGWKQAFGSAEGLVTTGPFRYSRNPVYVATWIGLLGWALCVPHGLVLVPLGLWAVLYVFAPSLEEPWLQEKFGAPYIAYKQRVRRFI